MAHNDTVDVTISLTVPEATGTFKSEWELQSSSGAKFGVGSSGDVPFYAQIKVIPAATVCSSIVTSPLAIAAGIGSSMGADPTETVTAVELPLAP